MDKKVVQRENGYRAAFPKRKFLHAFCLAQLWSLLRVELLLLLLLLLVVAVSSASFSLSF
jgi:uncharacterized integral membrane protein